MLFVFVIQYCMMNSSLVALEKLLPPSSSLIAPHLVSSRLVSSRLVSSRLVSSKVRSIHWFPYDRVGVVNADP